MSKSGRPAIPFKVQLRLWVRSGGRCQFEGCNKPLWEHSLIKLQKNYSYIAHIYAYSKNGSRYDPVLSPQLETDFTNLMLVCDECHRTFDDKSLEEKYPATLLIAMKKEHEERIEFVTGIQPQKKSHVILFGANIGQHKTPLQFEQVIQAMIPEYYPVMSHAIEIGLKNSSFEDSTDSYWKIEAENLRLQFLHKVDTLKTSHPVNHYCVFGLAPQPLLIQLGTLLNELYPADVYQLHRDPSSWKWIDSASEVSYSILAPLAEERKTHLVLKMELSALIPDERIYEALGEDCAIWSVTHANPHTNFMQTKADLRAFREVMRKTFALLTHRHGHEREIHLFPAMPVSAAIELGRVWMPKADLPLLIYDYNRKKDGFFPTIRIH